MIITAALREAHANAEAAGASFTDDASMLRWAGFEVLAVPGDPDNVKITTLADLADDELLDLVRRRVRLADALVGGDPDNEVGEVAPGGVADAHAAQLERLAQAARALARLLRRLEPEA